MRTEEAILQATHATARDAAASRGRRSTCWRTRSASRRAPSSGTSARRKSCSCGWPSACSTRSRAGRCRRSSRCPRSRSAPRRAGGSSRETLRAESRAPPCHALPDLRERRGTAGAARAAPAALPRHPRDVRDGAARASCPTPRSASGSRSSRVAALDGIFLQWLLDPDAIDLEALHAELRALRDSARGMVRRSKGARTDG